MGYFTVRLSNGKTVSSLFNVSQKVKIKESDRFYEIVGIQWEEHFQKFTYFLFGFSGGMDNYDIPVDEEYLTNS